MIYNIISEGYSDSFKIPSIALNGSIDKVMVRNYGKTAQPSIKGKTREPGVDRITYLINQIIVGEVIAAK